MVQAGAFLAAASRSRGLPAQALNLAEDPFRLGVSSGFPTDHSVVLWTRLAPSPLAADGGMPPVDVEISWELARDEQFRRIERRGNLVASAGAAHSARVEVPGLEPARSYWYRFVAGAHRSRTGRTRTLPALGSDQASLNLAVVSCQHYEHGHYSAYRHIADAAPELVVHLGDYIYEGAAADGGVRRHMGSACRTLEQYRQRYAQYLTDPLLQDAHAAAPWLVTWDDHEVANDYAGDVPNRESERETFLARRAAAYQAYFEHLPLPPSMALSGTAMPLFSRHRVGRLATIHMLDQRQYRSPEACAQGERLAGNRLDDNCAERLLDSRTMLGAAQERWFEQGLVVAPARWTLIGQGTVFTHLDEQPGEGRLYWSDAWNGYPAARQRLLDSLRRTESANPLVFTGDLHAFMASGVNAVPEQLDSPLVAAEFVTTSLSSNARPQATLDPWLAENPNISLLESRSRGYLRVQLGRELARVELMAVDDVRSAASGQTVLRSFVVEAGSPGILPA
jgi:alkaline phosphatase D